MRIAPLGRVAVIASLAATVALTSGCSWFRKDNAAYKLSGEARPLEVPPDLDRPSADKAMSLPAAGGSVSASGMNNAGGSSAAPIGFNASGDRDVLFAKVGEVLAATPGVKIANKAQILGTYDVDYMDAKFLVRVTKAGEGVYISAVDPRGLPPVGEAPVKLIGTLKAAIAP